MAALKNKSDLRLLPLKEKLKSPQFLCASSVLNDNIDHNISSITVYISCLLLRSTFFIQNVNDHLYASSIDAGSRAL